MHAFANASPPPRQMWRDRALSHMAMGPAWRRCGHSILRRYEASASQDESIAAKIESILAEQDHVAADVPAAAIAARWATEVLAALRSGAASSPGESDPTPTPLGGRPDDSESLPMAVPAAGDSGSSSAWMGKKVLLDQKLGSFKQKLRGLSRS